MIKSVCPALHNPPHHSRPPTSPSVQDRHLLIPYSFLLAPFLSLRGYPTSWGHTFYTKLHGVRSTEQRTNRYRYWLGTSYNEYPCAPESPASSNGGGVRARFCDCA